MTSDTQTTPPDAQTTPPHAPTPHAPTPVVDYDPLAAQRAADGPEFDVSLWGTVFLDIIFTGLRSMPVHGTEVMADGMGSSPGGIANLAVAARRLGLRTSLAAAFGDDDYADFCWRTLAEQEGVDLSRSRRLRDWHTPVTISLALERDRTMVTHAHEPPRSSVPGPAPSRAVLADLGSAGDPDGDAQEWLRADWGCAPRSR
ncbi:MAG: PfkB family carbohydrate kinase, partial [Lapillicoccus sp.]